MSKWLKEPASNQLHPRSHPIRANEICMRLVIIIRCKHCSMLTSIYVCMGNIWIDHYNLLTCRAIVQHCSTQRNPTRSCSTTWPHSVRRWTFPSCHTCPRTPSSSMTHTIWSLMPSLGSASSLPLALNLQPSSRRSRRVGCLWSA